MLLCLGTVAASKEEEGAICFAVFLFVLAKRIGKKGEKGKSVVKHRHKTKSSRKKREKNLPKNPHPRISTQLLLQHPTLKVFFRSGQAVMPPRARGGSSKELVGLRFLCPGEVFFFASCLSFGDSIFLSFNCLKKETTMTLTTTTLTLIYFFLFLPLSLPLSSQKNSSLRLRLQGSERGLPRRRQVHLEGEEKRVQKRRRRRKGNRANFRRVRRRGQADLLFRRRRRPEVGRGGRRCGDERPRERQRRRRGGGAFFFSFGRRRQQKVRDRPGPPLARRQEGRKVFFFREDSDDKKRFLLFPPALSSVLAFQEDGVAQRPLSPGEEWRRNKGSVFAADVVVEIDDVVCPPRAPACGADGARGVRRQLDRALGDEAGEAEV